MKRGMLVGLCCTMAVGMGAWSARATEPLPENPGAPLTLTSAPHPGTLTEPGWEVTSYKDLAWTDSLDDFKGSMAVLASQGRYVGHETGVPDIDFVGWGALPNNRPVPGFHDGYLDEFYGVLAKGWINFPKAGHYSLCLKADEAGEVTIANEVVWTCRAAQWGAEDITGGVAVDLDVQAAGTYPIQIVWFDAVSADAVEFYRRMGSPDRILAIGASDGGLADQPMVYQRLNGQAAPDLISTYPPINPQFQVNLDPGQKCRLPGGSDAVGTGAQGLKVKTVLAPWTYYSPACGYDMYFARDYPREEVWSTIPRRFLEFMGDINHGTATVEILNFNDGGIEGLIPGGTAYPGLPLGTTQFGIRADGFITFPTAGAYYLTMNANEHSLMRIGNQCMSTIYYDHGTMWFVWNVAEAGTYPISVELYEAGAGTNLELAELTPSGAVAVNAPGSSITFHESATSGTFATRPHGFVVAPERKVGTAGSPPGSAGTLGWNVTLAHTGNFFLDAGYSGLVSCLTENDYWGNAVASDIATDTPPYLDYKDPSDPFPGRFGGTLPWSRFANCQPDGNDKMCVSAVGYIEFPTAGYYGLNTTTNDSCTMWIAGQIVQSWPLDNTWPADAVQDNVPVSLYVPEAGIYDIRIDYWDVSGSSMLEVFQYLPEDRDQAAMLNAPNSTVKVYRTLNTPPTSNLYHNPMLLPVSAKVAGIDRGVEPGVRVQVVGFVPVSGDQQPHGGMGHDTLMSLEQANDLLKAVLDGDPVALLNQQGVVLADVPVTPFSVLFPAQSATRMTGYIGLKKGGHVFTMWSDEGFSMTIGGMNFARYSGAHGVGWFMYYVLSPEDGLYPFEVTHENTFDAGIFELREYHPTFADPYWITVNSDPAVSMVYVSYDTCPIPFADADRDGDVDQADFGKFQACFTGEAPMAVPGGACSCFDRGGTSSAVDLFDLTAFMACFSGPAIPTACQ